MRIAEFTSILVALLAIGASWSPVPPFFDAPVEPPAGRAISGWGEFSSAWDLGQLAGQGEAKDLAAYEKAVAPHAPALISFSVGPDFTIVSGFLSHYREFSSAHGFFVGQVAINFHGLEHDVAIGMRDPDLMVLADGLQGVGRPALVRIGPAFNAPEARYEASAYIGAFRHGTDVIRKTHMSCATVWAASARGLSSSEYLKWYPGDDVVDWWGVDLFDAQEFSRAETKAFVDQAAHHHKPVVIGATSLKAKSEAEALGWYAALFDFIRANPAVKAFSLPWPGTRLARWPKVAAYVKQQLADPRFIDASEAPAIFHPPRLEH